MPLVTLHTHPESSRYSGLGYVPMFVALSDVHQRTLLRPQRFMPAKRRVLANIFYCLGFVIVLTQAHLFEGFLWGTLLLWLAVWSRLPRHHRLRFVRTKTPPRDLGDLVLWHMVDDPRGRALLNEGERYHRLLCALARLSRLNTEHSDQIQQVFAQAGAIPALEAHARILCSEFYVYSAVNSDQSRVLGKLLSATLNQVRDLAKRQVVYLRPLNKRFGL